MQRNRYCTRCLKTRVFVEIKDREVCTICRKILYRR